MTIPPIGRTLPSELWFLREEFLADSSMNGTSLEDIQKKLEQVLARPVPLVQGGMEPTGLEPVTAPLSGVCSTN